MNNGTNIKNGTNFGFILQATNNDKFGYNLGDSNNIQSIDCFINPVTIVSDTNNTWFLI